MHHANRGKQQKDRRKLREKRRSTGVVHLASTESTGGSTTGDDEESSDAAVQSTAVDKVLLETRRNTYQMSPLPTHIDRPRKNWASQLEIVIPSQERSTMGVLEEERRGDPR